jgi:hypothetical protein
MSEQYGLLVLDAYGRTILDPDTFTVRLIDTLYLPAMDSASTYALPAPKARAGMFACATPHAVWNLPNSWKYWHGDYPSEVFATGLCEARRVSNSEMQYNSGRIARMPEFQVVDGAILVSPPMPHTRFSGNMTVYLFATI